MSIGCSETFCSRTTLMRSVNPSKNGEFAKTPPDTTSGRVSLFCHLTLLALHSRKNLALIEYGAEIQNRLQRHRPSNTKFLLSALF